MSTRPAGPVLGLASLMNVTSSTGEQRLRAEPLARARDRLLESFRAERLQQVVDGVDLERLQRVLIVRGDEDDRLIAAEQLEDLEAVQLRHLHVEQHEIRLQLGHGLDRFEAVRAVRDDLDARVRLRILAHDRPRERLVVHDHDRAAAFTHDGHRDARRETAVVSLRSGSIGARPRVCKTLEPLADVAQAEPGAASGRPIRVARIIDGNDQRGYTLLDPDVHDASLEHVRDAVPDGVLDERLQHERRDPGSSSAVVRASISAAARRTAPARRRETARQRQLPASGIRLRAPSASVSRRKSASSRHIRRAAGGSAVVNALIDCRLLNRKCGSICARRARSSASRASTCSSSPRRSASRER